MSRLVSRSVGLILESAGDPSLAQPLLSRQLSLGDTWSVVQSRIGRVIQNLLCSVGPRVHDFESSSFRSCVRTRMEETPEKEYPKERITSSISSGAASL
jgi:hypothetical protein